MLLFPLVFTRASLATETAHSAAHEFFEREVRPILVNHCYECHSSSSEMQGGHLSLEDRPSVLRGGDSGPAIIAGDVDASLLIQAIRYADQGLQMPPDGKLPDEAIRVLETWVREGAYDPREPTESHRSPSNSAAQTWDQIFEQRSQWWSLQPLRVTEPPAASPLTSTRDRPVLTPPRPEISEEIDRYLTAKLHEHGLELAAPTDPRTFIRRASIVLLGLPPTTDEVEAFVRDCDETRKSLALKESIDPLPVAAVTRLIDRLLSSPHFGERWARHWMDVVRFTETHGNEWNYEVHHAWRYRDYLIRAFNQDVPFDQMIREHIAGDLLESPRWNEVEQWNESVQATAFFRFGEVNHDDCISLRELGYDILDNQIDTLTKAFQATTVACARCHDHKLDAVSMRDYYGLLGILRSSRLVAHSIDSPDRHSSVLDQLEILQSHIRKELVELWRADLSRLAEDLRVASRESVESTTEPTTEPATEGDAPASRMKRLVELLRKEALPLDDPLAPWQRMAQPPNVTGQETAADPADFPQRWARLVADYDEAISERAGLDRGFESFADFTHERVPEGWQVSGPASSRALRPPGSLIVAIEGPAAITSILPAGFFTHVLSDKINGTLRSRLVPDGPKQISFEVFGQQSSAVRLVSNLCQLNYKNYRALTQPNLHWVTFSLPEDRTSLRTYAELMTKFDNPKFPDQLSALGGDPANYRMPWEKAAENPRSYFGITRVVLHDGPEPPRADLLHLRPILQVSCGSLDELVARYSQWIDGVLQRWEAEQATDEDVRWLSGLVRHQLLRNERTASPKLMQLVDDYRQVESQVHAPRVVPGVGESGGGWEQPLLVRGNCRREGEPVRRQFLEVLQAKGMDAMPISSTSSGRRELADQIASPQNPLTARVYVNRLWHHLFGAGIVRSVDDFGHVGDLPTHPELLDYLASQFMEQQWSTKRMVRAIALSQLFQASNVCSPESRSVDPGNAWLQHYPARRMEAEAIRDAILAVSGRLDRQLFGPSVQPYREKEYADRRLFPGPLDGDGRRSIYIKNNLMEAPKFLGAFNFPGGKVAQGRRDVTNVPAQALALLNDPLVIQQAEYWANRLVVRTDQTVSDRIDAVYREALGRPPSVAEGERMARLVGELSELHGLGNRPADLLGSPAIWKDVAHAVYNLKEFIYIP